MLVYLTYDEYKDYGGQVTEANFPPLNRRAQQVLDYITFNRIPKCWSSHDELPQYIITTMVDLVDKVDYAKSQSSDNRVITKYSNGVETLDYSVVNTSSIYEEANQLVVQNLPTFLTTKVVNFDVERYLQ